jgi:hypothetical protein
MAKVRIQARSSESKDSTGNESQLPLANGREKSKHIGAVDILARVWKREGFVGWYQVSNSCFALPRYLSTSEGASGDASTNYQGSSVTGAVVHVKRTIRALDNFNHDPYRQIFDASAVIHLDVHVHYL